MAEDKRGLLQRFIIWREKNIKEKQFILILSFLVGIFTAFAALILKVIIHWIQNFLTDNFNATEANYLYLVYPVVGIFLTGLFVRYVVKDDISHGVTKILYAISRRQGRIKRHNTWSSIIASSITIGFGGSVGAEAPIVLTGSAIGSNLGTIFKMEHRTLMLLVGCGAAGAVAGIFKAPIAGLVFTLEVLMIDLTMSSLLPLLISAVTAATVSYIVTGTDAMFKFHLDQAFELERIPYVIIYLVFKENGIFPVGTGLEKSDWLSFLGAYLSFIGTVIVSLIAIFQSIYYSELNERKDAENRKKEIQPIFSVKIVSIDMQLDGTAEAFSLYDKATNPIHKNVKISVENVNRFPIKHMIVFDKYITPLLKCNEIQYVHCAYYDSVDAKKWPKQMAVLTDEYERNDQGVPTWFNVNYEDVDGNEMFQRFELKDFDGKLYYALNSINDA